jgi:hypothetical protein
MSLLNILGWFLLSLPFIVVFIWGWKMVGLKIILAIFGLVLLIIITVSLGVYLLRF